MTTSTTTYRGYTIGYLSDRAYSVIYGNEIITTEATEAEARDTIDGYHNAR